MPRSAACSSAVHVCAALCGAKVKRQASVPGPSRSRPASLPPRASTPCAQPWTARTLVNAYLEHNGNRSVRSTTKISLEKLLIAFKEYFPEL